jgi:hypothetical protein
MDFTIEKAIADKEWQTEQQQQAALTLLAKPQQVASGENKPRPDGSPDYEPPSASNAKPVNPDNTLKQGV